MLPEQIAWVLQLVAGHGLRPWVDTGTALGLAREGRILWEPGKDDIDLSLWSDDEPALAATAGEFLAAGYKHEIWRWRGQPFKWKFIPPDSEAAYPVDFKLYRRAGDHCWTPLVYHRSPPTKPLWSLWRFWRRRMLGSGPERRLGEWPWNACIGVHTFWIPNRFFDELEPWRETLALVPRELDEFLSLHYGDWSRPTTPWDSAAQDLSIKRGSPQRVLRSMAAGGRAMP